MNEPRIWKYPIARLGDMVSHDIPAPAEILSIGIDPLGKPCAWVKVIPGEVMIETNFGGIGTGGGFPVGWDYLGHFVEGPLVHHSFYTRSKTGQELLSEWFRNQAPTLVNDAQEGFEKGGEDMKEALKKLASEPPIGERAPEGSPLAEAVKRDAETLKKGLGETGKKLKEAFPQPTGEIQVEAEPFPDKNPDDPFLCPPPLGENRKLWILSIGAAEEPPEYVAGEDRLGGGRNPLTFNQLSGAFAEALKMVEEGWDIVSIMGRREEVVFMAGAKVEAPHDLKPVIVWECPAVDHTFRLESSKMEEEASFEDCPVCGAEIQGYSIRC